MSSRLVTAATHPGRTQAGPAGAKDVIGACPSNPAVIIAGLQRSLFKALKRRADGSWHDDDCRNARVNSRPYLCSDPCLHAQIALFWAQTWRELYEQPAPTQPSLWPAPGPEPAMREERVS